ncbi:MAG: hypothetical protein H6745_12520 [Deltaproteobacteria bacterium]|nr:hypothetical protein [Deltaproteobacteria bacterium]
MSKKKDDEERVGDGERAAADAAAGDDAATEPLVARLHVTEAGSGELLLGFAIVNHGDDEVTLETTTPFLDFELAIESPGGPLEVLRNPRTAEIAREPLTLHIPPGGGAALATPVWLTFDAARRAAEPPNDPSCWVVLAPRQAATIAVSLLFGARVVGPCVERYVP